MIGEMVVREVLNLARHAVVQDLQARERRDLGGSRRGCDEREKEEERADE
jgi:hypothetical protein